MSNRSGAGSSGRRTVLVAVTVGALAVASLAGSMIAGASAAPAPSSAAPSVAGTRVPVVPVAAGARARAVDGQESPVVLGAGPLARRAGAARTTVPAAATASAQAAAAGPKPPAVTALGAGGVVATASSSLSYAPDGSRLAFTTPNYVYTARAGASTAEALIGSVGSTAVAWSTDGRLVSYTGSGTIQVASTLKQKITGFKLDARYVRDTSWLRNSTLVATIQPQSTGGTGTFDLVPVFGGATRRYAAPGDVTAAVASPDSQRIAVRLVRGTEGVDRTESIVVVDARTLETGPTVVTTTGTLGRPAWSNDGATVYVPRTQGGTTSVVAHAASTADGAATVVLANAAATPYVVRRPVPAGRTLGLRFGGRDAIADAIGASKELFGTARGGSCNQAGAAVSAVLARAGSVEATVGAPLAAHTCGPLLLTGARSLDSRTAAELKRLLRPGRTVHLIGGTASLSAPVATAVSRLGFKVARYAGTDVYGTAVQVFLKGWKKHGTAALASATQPSAAVVAAATAGSADVPLLLTRGATMPAVTRAYLVKYKVGAWSVGSQAAKAAPWAFHYSGRDDTATSVDVATRFFLPSQVVVLTVPNAQPEAYAAAGWSAVAGDPVLVVSPKGLSAGVRSYLDRTSGSIDAVLVYGTTRAAPAKILNDALALGGGVRKF